MVRGSDSEASEGGGFYAARRNGIHGAVDLNGKEESSAAPNFAYVRTFAGKGGSGTAAPISRIKDSGEGLRNDLAEDPIWAVGLRRCWEDPTAAMRRSTPSTVAMP
jgi:hypothetical protein